MIVTCEQCNSKFKLSQQEVATIDEMGRILRCGNCYHMWLTTSADNINAVSHQPTDNKLLENLQNNHKAAVTLLNMMPPEIEVEKIINVPLAVKLFFYTILFCAVIIISIASKNHLFNHVKAIAPILSLMGLSDTKGLEFEKITIVKSSLKKGKPLIISGYIINKSNKDLLVPDIRIQFLDDKGQVLYSMIYNLPVKLLKPGEKAKISNRFSAYPRDADIIILDIGNYPEFFMR